MSKIKVRDIAFGRLRSPDLDLQEEFLSEFGLLRVERTTSALYMRGTDPDQFIHVTEKGESGFIGLAFNAQNEDDLRAVAKLPGASGVEHMDEPGGGMRVRLRDPCGYQIEIVHGQAQHAPVPVSVQKLNTGAESNARAGELRRIHTGPSRVKRMGHGVVGSPNLAETVRWYRETLGLVGSDDVYAGEKDNVVGSFSRCDQGATYVDHHVFFCVQASHAGLNHFSFEVADFDDVFAGHEHLAKLNKYEHMWGIGRHLLGSQVFDYWADPWGRVHEHWSDTDRLNHDDPAQQIEASVGFGSQWGEPAPQAFIERIVP